MAFLLLLLGVLGAVIDWRYVRAGGARPTRKEWVYLGVTITICAVALIVLGLLGGSAEGLGQATALLGALVFVLWEFRRFRIRRSNPLRAQRPV